MFSRRDIDPLACTTLEQARGKSMSRPQVQKVLGMHEADPAAFDREFGVRTGYDAHAVMVWLGY